MIRQSPQQRRMIRDAQRRLRPQAAPAEPPSLLSRAIGAVLVGLCAGIWLAICIYLPALLAVIGGGS